MIILLVIALIILAVIFWQDWRSRAIWWFLPPALFAVFIAERFSIELLKMVLLNSLFVTGMIVFLVIYTRIRFGKLENPFKNYFGLGDFLFLLALTPLFPFQGFIWFFTAGTICVLLLHLIMSIITRNRQIPYAGYFSLFTAFYLIVNTCDSQLFHFLNYSYGTV